MPGRTNCRIMDYYEKIERLLYKHYYDKHTYKQYIHNMTAFAPHLFVRNISKNVTKDSLWAVFENLGFGVIRNIVIKPRAEKNNAIIYFQKWEIDDTVITRNMLHEGRALSITHEEDGSIWKVCAYDETRCGSIREFPDILHPNVTDNREQRMRNTEAANELFDDLRRNLFPLDNITYAPMKAKRFAPLCTERELSEVSLRMDELLVIDDPVPPVTNHNSELQPFSIDYGEVHTPPKRRVIKNMKK